MPVNFTITQLICIVFLQMPSDLHHYTVDLYCISHMLVLFIITQLI
jgi:hypothetical protein